MSCPKSLPGGPCPALPWARGWFLDICLLPHAPCPLVAPQLVKTFPQEKSYLPTYCPAAIYILTLLVRGYKFSEDTWSSIRFSQQVNGQAAVAGHSSWPEDAFRSSIPGVPCARNVSPSHGCSPVTQHSSTLSYLPPNLWHQLVPHLLWCERRLVSGGQRRAEQHSATLVSDVGQSWLEHQTVAP